MALINKTGIANSNVIQAEHVTRAIDALSGGSTDTIIATGSFSGSFVGDGSQLTGVGAIASKWSGSNPITRDSSVEITGSLVMTGNLDVGVGDGGIVTTDQLISNNYIELPGVTDDPAGVINNGTIWHRTDLNQLRVYLNGAVRIIDTSAPI
jgi:hypothetical protein